MFNPVGVMPDSHIFPGLVDYLGIHGLFFFLSGVCGTLCRKIVKKRKKLQIYACRTIFCPLLIDKTINYEEFLMNLRGQRLFEFHFKMDSEMKDALKDLDLYKKVRSLSQLIVKILSLLSPCLEKVHLSRKQRMSRYELVNNNREIRRESVHVYLPHSLYRQLKAMHHDLNFYSIAQLLRMMVRLFLCLVKVNGNIVIKMLMDLLRQWEEKNEMNKHTRKSIRQLLHFIYQKPGISCFLNLYDNKFSPVDILRL